MSVENRFDSSKLLMGTSSPASGTEELSLTDTKNEKKTKRYVKKKGETRKRNSGDGSLQQFVNSNSLSLMVPVKRSDSTEVVNDVSEKLQNMVIERGIKSVERQAENKKNDTKIANKESVGRKSSSTKLRNDKKGEKIREKNVERVGKNGATIAVKNEESKTEKKLAKTRKRYSGDGGLQQFVDSNNSSSSSKISEKTLNSEEISDDILEKIQKIVIKNEVKSPSLQAAKEIDDLKSADKNSVSKKGVSTKSRNDKNGEKPEGKNVRRVGKNVSTAVENKESETGKKLMEKKKENKTKSESKKTTTTTTTTRKKKEESEGSEPIRGKKSMIELVNDKSEDKFSQKNVCPVKTENLVQSSKKEVDKGKTEEQRKRDRQTARFARAVAKFSMKFVEAAKELGIVKPNEDSNSWSDCSGSSWTDSSGSSTCSCSACCTTDSPSCSCSDCRSQICSTSSSSDSELESSETSSYTSSSLSSSETV